MCKNCKLAIANCQCADTHILSIVSALDGVTLFITPAKEPGMVLVRMTINNDRFSDPLDCRIPASALLLAAANVHAIVNGLNPKPASSGSPHTSGGNPS